uniref:Uncharacterized protein n=1 Tax=Brassica oleracea TaxID=3712 RepID=A0A3P6DP07_BRAOL|nr:unnamed protein product [Brassica oleracea]
MGSRYSGGVGGLGTFRGSNGISQCSTSGNYGEASCFLH